MKLISLSSTSLGPDVTGMKVRVGLPALVLLFLALVAQAHARSTTPVSEPPPQVPSAVYYALPRVTYHVKLTAVESFEQRQAGGTIYAYPTFGVTSYEITALTEVDPATGYFLKATSGFWQMNGFGLELSAEGFPTKGSVSKAGGGYVAASHFKDALSVIAPVIEAVVKGAMLGVLKEGSKPEHVRQIPESQWAAQLFLPETESLRRIAELQAQVREHPGLDEADTNLRDAALKEIVRLRLLLTRDVTCLFRVEVQRAADGKLQASVQEVNVPAWSRAGLVRDKEGTVAMRYDRLLKPRAAFEPQGPLAARTNAADLPTAGAETDRLVFRLPVPCQFRFELEAVPRVTDFQGGNSAEAEIAKPAAPATVFQNITVTPPQAGPLSTFAGDPAFFKKRTVALTYHATTGTLSAVAVTDEGIGDLAKDIKTALDSIRETLKQPDEKQEIVDEAELLEAKLRRAKAEEALRAFTDKPADASSS